MRLRDAEERARRFEAFEQQLRSMQESLSGTYDEGLALLRQRYETFQRQGVIAAAAETGADAQKAARTVTDIAGDALASQVAEFQKTGDLLMRDAETVLDGNAHTNDRIASGTRLGIVGAGAVLLARWLLKKDPDSVDAKKKKGFLSKIAGGFWTTLKLFGVFALASRAVNYFGPEEARVQKPKTAEAPAPPPEPTPVPAVSQQDAPRPDEASTPSLQPAAQPKEEPTSPEHQPKSPESSRVLPEVQREGWEFGGHRISLVSRGGSKLLSVDGRVFTTSIVLFFKKDVGENIVAVERSAEGGLLVRYKSMFGEGSAELSNVECARVAVMLSQAKGSTPLTVQTREKGKMQQRTFECTPE